MPFFGKKTVQFPKEAASAHSKARDWSMLEAQETTKGFYKVKTDYAIRWTLGKLTIFNGYPGMTPGRTIREKDLRKEEKVVLVANGITNCQVILLRQAEQVWLLHTSPAAICQEYSNPLMAGGIPPHPYELLQNELREGIPLSLVIIPSRTETLWDEDSFFEITGLARENVNIDILRPTSFHEKEAKKHEKHHIAYEIGKDRLWLLNGHKNTTAYRYEPIFEKSAEVPRRQKAYYCEPKKEKVTLVDTDELDPWQARPTFPIENK
jgi:hypothetical protein